MSQVTLQTERLVLRPFAAGDGPAFYEYMADHEVARYTSLLPISSEQAQELVDNIVNARAASDAPPLAFGIALRGDGTLIGNCRLKRDRDDPGQADIAYFYFLSRHHWGRGYATETVRARIDYGFVTLGLRRIYGLCVPENVASRRVMEKAGMQAEEPLTFCAEQGHFHRGEFRDLTYLRYAIHRPVQGEQLQDVG